MPRTSVSRALLVAVALGGCAGEATVPDPKPAIDAYAEALEGGDIDALYQMMSAESRRSITKDELATVLKEQREELREHGVALRSAERVVSARAALRYEDGEVVTLDLDGGEFRVAAADALPAAARSPAQALGQLRRVLARRSYAGLLRVLSPRTRAAVERDVRALVEGLGEPDALQIDVVGDQATVEVPGGHQVKLRREDGVWHVEDFE